jgi:serine/threonine-protein kinase HipA
MKTQNRTLSILMNGILVGRLEKTQKSGLTFSYDPSWLDTPGARPISLSLPLVNQEFTGDIVYNFFDNLLPDNSQIRARIQAKFQIATNQPFDLLASIGRDCVGAIQIIEGEIPSFKNEINSETLNKKEIAAILRGYQSNPLGMTDNSSEFRISIAGAQEKSAFLYHNQHWCRPFRQTPTSHIFKLPIGFIQHQNMDLSDSCENEWLCSRIMDAFGLPVANCEIQHFEDVKTLVVERFDRKLSHDKTWLMRLPQEDMCQALAISPNLKYQADGGPGMKDIMNLLLGSSIPENDRDNFFRSQVIFWLLAAIDGHAKNFSIFLEPGGKYRLTPFYDIMSAYPLIEKKQLQKQKIKMAMALRGESNHYHWHNVQRRHFIGAAKNANYSTDKAQIILDKTLNNVDDVIEKVSAQLPHTFPKQISQSIFDGMQSMQQRLLK